MGAVSTVPARKVNGLCPDCPMYTSADDDQVKKTMSVSLEKFNKESGMSKHFALLKFNRALVSVSFQFELEFRWILTNNSTVYGTNTADPLFLFFFYINCLSFSPDLAHQPCYGCLVLPGVCSPVD